MYLYIVECLIRKTKAVTKNPLKIGVASNLDRRIKQLQNGNPFELRYKLAVKVESKAKAFELESDLHRIFRRERMMGVAMTGYSKNNIKFN